MAQDPKKPKKKRNTEYPLLFTAARTPLAPRVECAVFGCRRSDREPDASFLPFPEDPERWSEWLQLINRQDLAHKLRAGACAARVCSAHFAPGDTRAPALLLPTRTRVVYAEQRPSEMAAEIDIDSVVKIEEDEADTVETQVPQMEPVAGPPCPAQQPAGAAMLAGLLQQPRRHIPAPPRPATTPVIHIGNKPESRVIHARYLQPTYSESQINAAAQTDRRESFYRRATFSVLEKFDIPPTLAHQYADILKRSVHCETSMELLDYFTDGIKRQLGGDLEAAKKKLEIAENTPWEKNRFIKNCDKYLDEKISNFVKSHAYLTNKFSDKKYPHDFKYFALNLYLLNPQSYKFVEQFFELPSRRRIERFHFPARSGIDYGLLTSLKIKTDQLTVKGKMCVVSFGVIPLRKGLYYDVTSDYLCGVEEIDEVISSEPAEYAAVVMVRGLYNRWKQPVSFALLSEKRSHPELKAWVLKIIATLFDMGLLVKAFVTDSDDEFLDFSEESFEVAGRQIYHMYDVPCLLKNVRDAIIQYDFLIHDTVPKWDDVVNVYNFDKQQVHRVMPDITEEHVKPRPSSSEDVKLATQVFSRSVAAAMHFQVVAKLLPKRTKDTVEFLKRFSNLYEMLSSRMLANAYRATTAQQRYLKDTMKWLSSIEVTDMYGNVIPCKFITGLIHTIKSVMLLMKDLKKSNLNYLLTKNVSLDCMRAFFDNVKRLRKTDHPTPINFIRGFRRLYLVYLLKNTKTGAEGDDVMKTLVKIGEYVKVDLEKKAEIHSDSFAVGVNDYNIQWPSNEYIAGYLLWKCIERHKCKILIQKLCVYYNFEEQSNADLLLHTFQCYNSDNINRSYLTKPPKALVEFVELMENKYTEYMKTFKRNANFGRSVYAAIESDTFDMPCQCFPIKFLKRLYIRLKIYESVNMCNKRFRNGGKDASSNNLL